MTGAASDPWFTRVRRWGQTNLTELDPTRYPNDLWREQWRATGIDAVIVNAGGIVAYYPTAIDDHTRAVHLGDRNLFGEVVADARAAGLAVVARMDSSRVGADAAARRPEWLARDASGAPYRAGDLTVACVNSPYYTEHLPAVLAEIIAAYRPDGFADNSWAGLDRRRVCHCEHCRTGFRDAVGLTLPTVVDPTEATYRSWYRWNVARRSRIWTENARIVRDLGGADCLWLGMLPGSVTAQVDRFIDARALLSDTRLALLDHQFRGRRGFEDNAETGRRLTELMPAGSVLAESMAMYRSGNPVFRLAAMPAGEATLWMAAGAAGGIDPWWHHIGAVHGDRRQYDRAGRLFAWHRRNEAHLHERTPVARVALIWSDLNAAVYGGDDAVSRTTVPADGFRRALLAARIPATPLHIDDLAEQGHRFTTVVLPQLAVLTAAQRDAVAAFVTAGGNVIASGPLGALDENGDPAPAGPLAEILGTRPLGTATGELGPHTGGFEDAGRHTYLERTPDWPESAAPIWSELTGTDLIGFGGRLEHVAVRPGAHVLATAVPAFGVYPPETSWRPPVAEPGLPAIVVTEGAGGRRRTVHLAADLDRCAGRNDLADHHHLLAGLFRWTLRGPEPVLLEGPGRIDLHPYRQGDHWVIHLLDVGRSEATPGTVEDLWSIGPYRLGVHDPDGALSHARGLVAGDPLVTRRDGPRLWVSIPALTGHEVIVVTPGDPESLGTGRAGCVAGSPGGK
ncbi:alpha-amylase family protein [Occultella kanbiaonis]|uniref:alpha-amylase family protein n=1 Tax=Occultella kanbiaonis TaxID=2675754 RepID=UPI0013D0C552|nr:alpha-amylase family protein [Occultella kanbiaonis]